MVRFRTRRLFPVRRYPMPLRWVFLALAAGLVVMMAWVARRFL